MKKIPYFILGFFSFLMVSCYPDEFVSTEELDIVATFYDENALKIHAYRTYMIPDSVIHIDENGNSDRSFDVLIVNTINQNMSNYGYQRLSNSSSEIPDLVILPEVITQRNYEVGGCWDCWGWYDPWYPGWGYYPSYPPGYVYSYKVGTIFIATLDYAQILNQEEEGLAVWAAFINGIVREDVTGAEIQNHINQAFDQSPYLLTTRP